MAGPAGAHLIGRDLGLGWDDELDFTCLLLEEFTLVGTTVEGGLDMALDR